MYIAQYCVNIYGTFIKWKRLLFLLTRYAKTLHELNIATQMNIIVGDIFHITSSKSQYIKQRLNDFVKMQWSII